MQLHLQRGKKLMDNELDLQDETRMWDIYNELQEIVVRINALPVFPSLVWVWSWDVVMDKFNNYQADNRNDEDYVIAPGLTPDQIFKMFWEDADKNGFTLEYGIEDLDESIFDWMVDRDILVMIESSGEEV